MSFTSTLAKLLKRDTEAKADAEAKYRELVRDAGADRPVSEAAITSVLDASGHGLADLERDVSAERDRIANIGVASRRTELLSELSRVHQAEAAEIVTFKAELVQLQERHVAAMTEFQDRGRLLNTELDHCMRAERSLTTGHPRIVAIRRQIGQLRQEEQRTLMRFAGQRSRVPHGTQVATQLARIDQDHAKLTRELESIEAELLSVN